MFKILYAAITFTVHETKIRTSFQSTTIYYQILNTLTLVKKKTFPPTGASEVQIKEILIT